METEKSIFLVAFLFTILSYSHTQIVFIAKKNKKKSSDLFIQTFSMSSYCLLI